jgi:type VI secretion system FHA domain protein
VTTGRRARPKCSTIPMYLNPLRADGTGRYSEHPMLLTLEVISPNGASLGPNRRKTVGPEGVQIGRGKDNDWVIGEGDRFVSRVHARIRYVNGAFYVEGLGRNPLAINDAQNTVQNNDPQLLRSGDCFFLDRYEIRATLATHEVVAPADDPFSVETAPPAIGVAEVPNKWGAAGSLDGIAIQDGESQQSGNLDPLEALGGPVPRAAAPPMHVPLQQGCSVLDDNYCPQQPIAIAGEQIPDTWDRSKITNVEPPSGWPSPAPSAPARRKGTAPAAAGAIPESWDRSGTSRLEPPQPPTPRPPPPTPTPASKSGIPKTVRRPVAANADARKPFATHQPTAAPPPAMRPEVPASSAPQASALGLEHLLRAAGVSASEMTPQLAAELGEVFRIVVQGVMEVLQSRAEIKSQLRMSGTRMKPTENNPLKFSPNVEAALHTLLVERNRGYLTTTRAFQEAFTDIRDHQIAVLQGIRAAFDAMLEQFDPERIEEEMNRGSSRPGGLLSVGAKSRFRDFYLERFAHLRGDRDETFRQLFGDYFAQAYEEQLNRLKAMARTSGG